MRRITSEEPNSLRRRRICCFEHETTARAKIRSRSWSPFLPEQDSRALLTSSAHLKNPIRLRRVAFLNGSLSHALRGRFPFRVQQLHVHYLPLPGTPVAHKGL